MSVWTNEAPSIVNLSCLVYVIGMDLHFFELRKTIIWNGVSFHVLLGSRLCDRRWSRKTAILDPRSCYWCPWYFTRCMFCYQWPIYSSLFPSLHMHIWITEAQKLCWFMQEGLAMIDDGHKDGKRRYWFPCVSSISNSVADTWTRGFQIKAVWCLGQRPKDKGGKSSMRCYFLCNTSWSNWKNDLLPLLSPHMHTYLSQPHLREVTR